MRIRDEPGRRFASETHATHAPRGPGFGANIELEHRNMQSNKPPSPGATVRRLERALQRRPLDVAAHQHLAEAHRKLLQRSDREQELAAICQELPFAFTSQLHLGALAEQRGDRWAATTGFLRAIRTAQLRVAQIRCLRDRSSGWAIDRRGGLLRSWRRRPGGGG